MRSFDGLLTGFHEARSTHFALPGAWAEESLLRRAYGAAARGGFLWHKFGDSHLILAGRTA